jgi:hypothetical protein
MPVNNYRRITKEVMHRCEALSWRARHRFVGGLLAIAMVTGMVCTLTHVSPAVAAGPGYYVARPHAVQVGYVGTRLVYIIDTTECTQAGCGDCGSVGRFIVDAACPGAPFSSGTCTKSRGASEMYGAALGALLSGRQIVAYADPSTGCETTYQGIPVFGFLGAY